MPYFGAIYSLLRERDLSNSVARNHSFRHTTSVLYRQIGLHENKGRTLLQNIHPGYHERHLCRTLNTVGRIYLLQIRENPMIVRKISTGKPVAVNIALIFRIPGIPHSAVEQVETNREEKVRQTIEEFEITETGICCSRTLRNRRRSTTSIENQRIWLLNWATTKRDFFEKTMFRLRLSYGDWYRVLHMQKMLAAYGDESTIQQRQIWLIDDSWKQKKNQSHGLRHGQTMRQIMYHKARDMLKREEPNFQRTVHAKSFWKDGTQMQTIRSRSLLKFGQKIKLKSTTHSPWKTTLMKQHLKKGDDGKGIVKLLLQNEYKLR